MYRECSEKIKFKDFSQPMKATMLATSFLYFILSSGSLRLQLKKITLLAKSSLYFIFLPGSLCSSNVYRHESGRCHTLPFFLTFSIISPFQVFLLHYYWPSPAALAHSVTAAPPMWHICKCLLFDKDFYEVKTTSLHLWNILFVYNLSEDLFAVQLW